MSNSYQNDEISSIAGEPANNSPLKPVPPIDGRLTEEQMEERDDTVTEEKGHDSAANYLDNHRLDTIRLLLYHN